MSSNMTALEIDDRVDSRPTGPARYDEVERRFLRLRNPRKTQRSAALDGLTTGSTPEPYYSGYKPVT